MQLKDLMDHIIRKGHFGQKPDIKFVKDRIKHLKSVQGFKESLSEKDFDKTILPLFDNMTWQDMHSFFWRYFALRKQEGKITVAHRYEPHSLVRAIQDSMDTELEHIKTGHEIVHADYPFIYTKADKRITFIGQEGFPDMPVVQKYEDNKIFPIQNTVSAYVAKGRPHTKEHGFYKGIKVVPSPAFSTTPFLGEVMGPALDSILDSDFDTALVHIKELLEVFRKNVVYNQGTQKAEEKVNHLSFNKSKKTYIGRSAGGRYEFALPETYPVDGKEESGPFEGKDFAILQEEDDKKKKKEIKAYLHTVEAYDPDYAEIVKLYRKKIKDFLAGITPQTFEQGKLLDEINALLRKPDVTDTEQGVLF